jgi:hypothetical protein
VAVLVWKSGSVPIPLLREAFDLAALQQFSKASAECESVRTIEPVPIVVTAVPE